MADPVVENRRHKLPTFDGKEDRWRDWSFVARAYFGVLNAECPGLMRGAEQLGRPLGPRSAPLPQLGLPLRQGLAPRLQLAPPPRRG